MKNLFHIGYHKTATTWFQKHFYTKVQNVNIVKRNKIRNYFYDNMKIDFSSESSLIFCDEELSGNIHTGGHSGFLSDGVARKISKIESPKVIIFIRNQYDIISSSYLQYVKKGGTYGLNRYLYHKDFPNSNRAALFSFSHFSYLQKIRFYESLIGKENVFVYLYEDFKNNQDIFLKQFSEDHNFEINLNEVSLKNSNKSYSYISLFISRTLNIFSRKDVLYKYYLIHIPFLYEMSQYLMRLLNIGNINLFNFLGDKNRKHILSFYKQMNNELEEFYNLDLKKYNYPL